MCDPCKPQSRTPATCKHCVRAYDCQSKHTGSRQFYKDAASMPDMPDIEHASTLTRRPCPEAGPLSIGMHARSIRSRCIHRFFATKWHPYTCGTWPRTTRPFCTGPSHSNLHTKPPYTANGHASANPQLNQLDRCAASSAPAPPRKAPALARFPWLPRQRRL